MYLKIPLDISFTSTATRGALAHRFGSISYYTARGLLFPPHILSAIQPDYIRFVEITGAAPIQPHKDHISKTVLNCYFQSGTAETVFWKAPPNASPRKHPGASTANIFSESQLIRIGSFIANDGDAYLLDVSCIHSVRRTSGAERRFIQLSWNKNFTEVLDILKAGIFDTTLTDPAMCLWYQG